MQSVLVLKTFDFLFKEEKLVVAAVSAIKISHGKDIYINELKVYKKIVINYYCYYIVGC